MRGLDVPQGIDRLATLRYLNAKPGKADGGMMRGILAGSIRVQKRLFEAALVESALCQFCLMCDETVEHCFWECPQWSHIREQHQLPLAAVSRSWPVCTRACGLFLNDACVLDLHAELEQEESEVGQIAEYFGCQDTRSMVQSCQDQVKQVIWTDGACKNNQDHRFRRAGCGIFYGPAHHMNLSVILPVSCMGLVL